MYVISLGQPSNEFNEISQYILTVATAPINCAVSRERLLYIISTTFSTSNTRECTYIHDTTGMASPELRSGLQ